MHVSLLKYLLVFIQMSPSQWLFFSLILVRLFFLFVFFFCGGWGGAPLFETFSSPSRDWTCAPCRESSESSLDCQWSPSLHLKCNCSLLPPTRTCLFHRLVLSVSWMQLHPSRTLSPKASGSSRVLCLTTHIVSRFCWLYLPNMGLPGWLSGKESVCQCRRRKRLGFYPWVGKIPWRRKWQATPVFLPGKSHGQRSLAGWFSGAVPGFY